MPCYRVEVDTVRGLPDFGECRVARAVARHGGVRTFYVECSRATVEALIEQPGVMYVAETRDADCAPDPPPS